MSQKEFIKSGKDSIRYNSIKELNQMLEEINKPNEYEINRAFLYKERTTITSFQCFYSGSKIVILYF